jgi:recombination protein RecR
VALFHELTDALRCLPGVGEKTALRLALHLLERNRSGGTRLGEVLLTALDKIGHCQHCRNFTEHDQCDICANPRRDTSLICLVETPAELLAIERAGVYSGRYFVLMGHLSPIDGIGPDALGLPILARQFEQGEVREIIVATNPTIEGEATAEFVREMARPYNISMSRIAHGVPLGGELGYLDQGTISHAFVDRRAY